MGEVFSRAIGQLAVGTFLGLGLGILSTDGMLFGQGPGPIVGITAIILIMGLIACGKPVRRALHHPADRGAAGGIEASCPGGEHAEPERARPRAGRKKKGSTAYFGPSGRSKTVEVEGAFRRKWKGCYGDVALPFRHMWHALS